MGVGSDALRRGGPAPASGEDAASPSGERGPARPAGDSVWLILAVVGVIAVGIALPVRRPLRPLGRRGHLGQHLPAAARRPAGGAAPRRRPAALLRPPPLLDGGLRHRQRGGPGALGRSSASSRWSPPGTPAAASTSAAPRPGSSRPDSRFVAWASVLLLAASPFAIRYATEARMYSLVILLVYVGYLALAARARPAVVGPAPRARRGHRAAALHALLGVRAAGRRRGLDALARGARPRRPTPARASRDRRARGRRARVHPVGRRRSSTRPRTPARRGAASSARSAAPPRR